MWDIDPVSRQWKQRPGLPNLPKNGPWMVTPDEWTLFEQHFQLRRVELDDCFRPYGTPCVHERCIRCPFLRVDPEQAPRLEVIDTNTQERLAEARSKQWLGEVAALEESLRHIRTKRAQLTTASPRVQFHIGPYPAVVVRLHQVILATGAGDHAGSSTGCPNGTPAAGASGTDRADAGHRRPGAHRRGLVA